MCVPYDGACPGRLSPDEPTLHIGDFIVFEAVDAEDLSVDYPNSDIIVFHEPGDPEDILVSRIVAVNEIEGKLYFRTKGDGNSRTKWPDTPSPSEYDPWETDGVPGVREDLVVGKVVNTNLSLFLLNASFWTLIGLSLATGITTIIAFVYSSCARYTTYTTTKQFFHEKRYMYTHNEKLEKLENFELINYSPKGD